MDGNLSFDLHVLTARLDRAADRILRAECDVSYRRFLALTLIGRLGASTQRALADGLGVTEPSASRMAGVLAEAGLLEVEPDPAGGHRRRLELTHEGARLVATGQRVLEERLADLVAHSDVPYVEYARNTRRLLETLDRVERENAR
jgi:DNA-binding MarR family transcriptional regulator